MVTLKWKPLRLQTEHQVYNQCCKLWVVSTQIWVNHWVKDVFTVLTQWLGLSIFDPKLGRNNPDFLEWNKATAASKTSPKLLYYLLFINKWDWNIELKPLRIWKAKTKVILQKSIKSNCNKAEVCAILRSPVSRIVLKKEKKIRALRGSWRIATFIINKFEPHAYC